MPWLIQQELPQQLSRSPPNPNAKPPTSGALVAGAGRAPIQGAVIIKAGCSKNYIGGQARDLIFMLGGPWNPFLALLRWSAGFVLEVSHSSQSLTAVRT